MSEIDNIIIKDFKDIKIMKDYNQSNNNTYTFIYISKTKLTEKDLIDIFKLCSITEHIEPIHLTLPTITLKLFDTLIDLIMENYYSNFYYMEFCISSVYMNYHSGYAEGIMDNNVLSSKIQDKFSHLLKSINIAQYGEYQDIVKVKLTFHLINEVINTYNTTFINDDNIQLQHNSLKTKFSHTNLNSICQMIFLNEINSDIQECYKKLQKLINNRNSTYKSVENYYKE